MYRQRMRNVSCSACRFLASFLHFFGWALFGSSHVTQEYAHLLIQARSHCPTIHTIWYRLAAKATLWISPGTYVICTVLTFCHILSRSFPPFSRIFFCFVCVCVCSAFVVIIIQIVIHTLLDHVYNGMNLHFFYQRIISFLCACFVVSFWIIFSCSFAPSSSYVEHFVNLLGQHSKRTHAYNLWNAEIYFCSKFDAFSFRSRHHSMYFRQHKWREKRIEHW